MNRFVCSLIISIAGILPGINAAATKPEHAVISFYTAKNDQAHIGFVREADKWFSELAVKKGFIYESTSDWSKMNDEYLSNFDVIIFFDTRPDSLPAREAFRRFIEKGGGFMGFHFSAFALTPSAFPQNWDWYHNDFLGCGEYKGNTWRPTSAILKLEARAHPSLKGLPDKFLSSPNEWYSWKNDLRNNKDILILLSIDPSSFPLGTGPKQHEIWHEGYYPVAWTNKKYRMIYINMGHNDIDYEGKTNRELSQTFGNKLQDRFIVNSLSWLLKSKVINSSF